jgi:3-hydroxyisobutyrate dehydrogenase-like beta-hydroxyacid dehydrogenase
MKLPRYIEGDGTRRGGTPLLIAGYPKHNSSDYEDRMSQTTNSTEGLTAAVSPKNTTVGIVGLGDMGAAIASSIVRTFPLIAFDLRKEAVDKLVALGARRTDSLQTLADQCEVIVLVVVDDKQVKQVVSEVLRHPGKLHTIIVSSTVLPSTVIALSEQVTKAGLDLIDAPVSGGAERASAGTITVLIGGEDAAVRRCWPILESFGRGLFHLGPLGAGSAGKLVNNLLSLGGNMLVLEAMQLAEVYGISEDAVTEFIPLGTGDSRNIRTWGRIDRARRSHTLAGTPAIYDIFSKDVKAAATAAGQRGVVLPIAATIGAMMAEKMKSRDQYLAARGLTAQLPLCTSCGQELALPYRKSGVHPECAFDPRESAR